eukprot:2816891-Rhodomonas_salina.3
MSCRRACCSGLTSGPALCPAGFAAGRQAQTEADADAVDPLGPHLAQRDCRRQGPGRADDRPAEPEPPARSRECPVQTAARPQPILYWHAATGADVGCATRSQVPASHRVDRRQPQLPQVQGAPTTSFF